MNYWSENRENGTQHQQMNKKKNSQYRNKNEWKCFLFFMRRKEEKKKFSGISFMNMDRYVFGVSLLSLHFKAFYSWGCCCYWHPRIQTVDNGGAQIQYNIDTIRFFSSSFAYISGMMMFYNTSSEVLCRLSFSFS